MDLNRLTFPYHKICAALLVYLCSGIAYAQITPVERQQIWIRAEPVLRAQLAQPFKRPFTAEPWQVPARLIEQIAAYDALTAAGWAERAAATLPAPVAIKGAVVQRTEPGWRYNWTPQGLAALAEGGLPWAEVRLERLDSITCANRACTQMDIQFHWRTGRIEPWAVASFFREWPGQNALLAALTNGQPGTAKMYWVTESADDDVSATPYWNLFDVQLWSP